VEEAAASIAESSRPQWHLRCLQEACSDEPSGVTAIETCSHFMPRAEQVFRVVSILKPATKKVFVFSDGSSFATNFATNISSFDTKTFCVECSVFVEATRSLDELRAKMLQFNIVTDQDAFVILPSIRGIGGSAQQVWEVLQTNFVAIMVPDSVARLGGLVGLGAHFGAGAEECSLRVAQDDLDVCKALPDTKVGVASPCERYEVLTSDAYQLVLNQPRAQELGHGIHWYAGSLYHNSREFWHPVEVLWQTPSTAAASKRPKVLVVHAYNWNYQFTASEHLGFLRGMHGAGQQIICAEGGQACAGSLDVRVLYWLSKFVFKGAENLQIMAEYTKEYIKRWKPDAVFFTDDNVLKHLVLPCFQPLERGPNPRYHECSQAQFVGSGINAQVKRVYRDMCLEYTLDGSCVRGNFFTEAGASVSAACDSCKLGNEPECSACKDLYKLPRPVNITMHLETLNMAHVLGLIKSVKPVVEKILFISDRTITSTGWQEGIQAQYEAARKSREGTHNITIDFDKDWHMLSSIEEVFQVLAKYQGRQEYIVMIPSTLAFLKQTDRHKFWNEFIMQNFLGEVLQPGETDQALLSVGSHAVGMARIGGQYVDFIVRGVKFASELPIIEFQAPQIMANEGRAYQLEPSGVVPIPEQILEACDKITSTCPPGYFRLDSDDNKCIPCPEGTSKSTYGDGASLCAAGPVEGVQTWKLVTAIVGVITVMSLCLACHLCQQADGLWLIDETELEFADPPQVLGRGTYGLVEKAMYRGTAVAVKRVMKPLEATKEDLKMRRQQMAKEGASSCFGSFRRFGRSSSSSSSSSSSDTNNPDYSSDDMTAEEQGAVDKRNVLRTRTSFVTSVASNWKFSQMRRDFIHEMRVLARLRHPCVTTVLGACLGKEPRLVMELMAHGSLYDVLHNPSIELEDELAVPILMDVASGMRFLHGFRPPVVHADLKAQNVLVDEKFRAKVADFGLTHQRRGRSSSLLGVSKSISGSASASKNLQGSLYWSAPELLSGKAASPASDVYAYGILLFEVCSGEDPYKGMDVEKVRFEVLRGDPPLRPTIPAGCRADVAVMMQECWQASPSLRPTFQELDRRLEPIKAQVLARASSSSSLREPGDDRMIHTVSLSAPRRAISRSSNVSRDRRTDDLLYDVFPKHVADALREGQKVEPESREVVTIFFSDIVGFTDISSTLEPHKISDMLDRLYTKFDALSRQYAVFKVETIGDAYMAVTNLAEDQPHDHAKRIALFAINAILAANQTLVDESNAAQGYINIRVGFHSGAVVANVVGTRNLRYCLFGDTVNTASRMESNSIKNCIHCSERAALLLQQQAPEIPIYPRGLIEVKGKGEMATFWVSHTPPGG